MRRRPDERSSLPLCEGRLRRTLCFGLGSVFLVVGAVGVMVPVLPTTPFLILAAFFYARSSRRCYRWLMTNRVFGRYLEDYLCGRGVPWRVKACALALLWAAIMLSTIFLTDTLWLRVLLPLIAVGVTIHIVLLRGRQSGE